MEQQIIDFLVPMVTSAPWLSSVLIIFGIMRSIFKPACALYEAYVSATPSTEDDATYMAFKTGKIYFVIDYLFSIKIPK